MPRPTPKAAVACSLVAAAVALSGCSSPEQPRTGSEPEQQGQVLQPGRPGEPNETLGADATVESAPSNDADVMFMQMMVPHHAQALEMSELAETRARDEQVVALARRIEGAQGPEITAMAGWLQARGVEVPESAADVEGHGSHGGHGSAHMGAMMPGMLTDEQMAQLEAARGDRFDRLFLAGMSRHHRGAVEMAQTEMTDGSEVLALELAGDIATGQQAEIDRMDDIRRQL